MAFISQANEQLYGNFLSKYVRISVLPEYYSPEKAKNYSLPDYFD